MSTTLPSILFAQPRSHLPLPDILELAGRARHSYDDPVVFFSPPTRRRAHAIGNGAGGWDKPGLLDVAGGHFTTARPEYGGEMLQLLRVYMGLFVEDLRYGFTGDVITGGAKAAGSERIRVPLPGAPQDFHVTLWVVADQCCLAYFQTELGQLRRQPRGVGVLDLSHEQLRSTGNDFSIQRERYLSLHWSGILACIPRNQGKA